MAISTVQATINGQTYTLTLNGSTGKYEATVTAPSNSSYNNNGGHYFPVSITATDDAGNTKTVNDTDGTLGTSLKLYVKEKVKPTITITNPTSNATLTINNPSITIQVRDADSGINPATFSMKIDGGTAIVQGNANLTLTSVAGGYNATYNTPALGDGGHTITVDVTDFDGNTATQTTQSFTVDTAPPTLSVTYPTNNLATNNATLTIEGDTNDTTSNCTVAIKLNDVDQGTITVDGSGHFTKTVTLATGTNTIVVTSTDEGSKVSTVTRTVKLDQVAPTIVSITLTPNPVDAGQTYIIALEVTDA